MRSILFEITRYDPKVLLAVAAIVSAATPSAFTIPGLWPLRSIRWSLSEMSKTAE
jgi:hypothetical protein